MKKALLVAGVAVLALASIASAYTFSNNLTVGSTGADVSALQSALIAAGYSIPSISSGAAQPGYFGSQTKAAVVAYQTANSLPSTGFVGPLTRGVLNGGASMSMTPASTACPVGYTCTPKAGTVTTTTGGATVTSTVTAPTGITTPGVSGTLTISNSGSVANGATFNTGQTVNIAGLKLQAGPSDMQVNTMTFDFNVRPWLYFSTFSIVNQTTGQVLVPATAINASTFTELTASEDYRYSISGLNFVIPHGQTVNVVLSAGSLSGISQSTGTYIDIIAASIRSTDGTGVVDTENLSTLALPYTTLSPYGSVVYNGNQTANLIASIDPTSPNAQVIQTQTGSVTNNIPLAVFDVQAQNNSATLQGLTINIGVNGLSGASPSTPTLLNVFNTIQLIAGGNTYYGTITPNSTNAAIGTVVFNSSVSVPLPLAQNVPLKIVANVNQGVTNITASTSLVTTTASNFVGVDSNYNTPTVNNNGTVSSAITTFSTNAAVTVTAGTVGTPTYTATTQSNITGNTAATFPFSFTVAAGTSPVYISATPAYAVAVISSLTGAAASTTIPTSISGGTTIPGDTNSGLGTGATGAFIVPSNSSRTFTVNVIVNNAGNAGTATGAIVGIGSVYYSSSQTITGTSTESVYSSNLSSLQSQPVSLLNR